MKDKDIRDGLLKIASAEATHNTAIAAIMERLDYIDKRISGWVDNFQMVHKGMDDELHKADLSRTRLAGDIAFLSQQLECAAKGHIFTFTGPSGSTHFGFKCINCALTYYRYTDSLTPHEKELVEVTKKPPPYAVPCEGS